MIAAIVLAAALDASAFSYDAKAPLNVKYSARINGIAEGEGSATHPAVLFVHWLGDDEASTNHTESQHDAAALAKRGATSLLIDAMARCFLASIRAHNGMC